MLTIDAVWDTETGVSPSSSACLPPGSAAVSPAESSVPGDQRPHKTASTRNLVTSSRASKPERLEMHASCSDLLNAPTTPDRSGHGADRGSGRTGRVGGQVEWGGYRPLVNFICSDIPAMSLHSV
jgi:hypothetical protein